MDWTDREDETATAAAADRARARRRALRGIAAALALAVTALAVLSDQFANRALEERFEAWAGQRRNAFTLSVNEKLDALTILAELLARDPALRERMRQAGIALAMEGGGSGGPLTARYRADLADLIAPKWAMAAQSFGVGLLSAHLGPEATTFLRMHAPDLHGDRLFKVRPMLADALSEAAPRQGFEVGYVGAGLRGVAPVLAPGEAAPIGLIAAGAPFDALVQRFAAETGDRYAVLLRSDRAPAIDLQMTLREREHRFGGCRCMVEGAAGPGVMDLLDRAGAALAETGWRRPALFRAAAGIAPSRSRASGVGTGAPWMLAAAWPLRAFGHGADGAEPDGRIVVIADVTGAVLAHRRERVLTALGGGLAFLLLLSAVWAVQRRAARQFETALARATADLAASREEALAANAAKSRFLAHMSHEIRTPLNGVLGMAELLARTPLDAEQQAQAAAIRRSGEFLLATVNDVLDVSKIEAGALKLELAPFSAADAIEDVRALHAPTAAAAGLTLVAERRGASVARLGDGHRLAQILHNLVGNALKFTETGGVTLTLDATDPARLSVTVRDTGPGMTPEVAARVFAPFEQAEAGTARRFGGSGLGLAIVRGLVEAMGGEIALDTAPGQGTAATVLLPFPAVAAAAGDGVARGAPAAEAAPAPPPPGLRVLAADDNEINRAVLAGFLRSLGAEAEITVDGPSVVAAFARNPERDVLLLDVSMPGMDGPDALAAIRKREAALGRPPAPALAVTAHAMAEQAEALIARGFDGHLPKPLDREALARALARHVAKAVAAE